MGLKLRIGNYKSDILILTEFACLLIGGTFLIEMKYITSIFRLVVPFLSFGHYIYLSINVILRSLKGFTKFKYFIIL